MHKCPTGCGRLREQDHLMCRSCWYKVPSSLRRDVGRAWHRYRRAGRNERDWNAYLTAREAAIASVP